MSVPVIQVGALGVVFVFTVKDETNTVVDLSTATVLNALFRAGPRGVLKTFPGSLTTDGTDGKFQYVTENLTDLDVAHGCWQRQGIVTVPAYYSGHTETKTFPVKPNLT